LTGAGGLGDVEMTIETNLAYHAASMHAFRSFKDIVNPIIRTQLRTLTQSTVNKIHPFQSEFEISSDLVDKSHDALMENGVIVIKNILSGLEIANVRDYVAGIETSPPKFEGAPYYYPADVIYNCPHVFDKLFNEHTLSVVSKYLGVTPTVINIELFKTNASIITGFEDLHRDRFDFHSINFVLYLSDVSESGGATTYLQKSHTLDGFEQLLRNPGANFPSDNPLDYFQNYMSSVFDKENSERVNTEVKRLFQDDYVELTGAAGNLNIFDSFGFHSGAKVAAGERLALRVVFALTPKIPFAKNDIVIPTNEINSANSIPYWMKYIHRLFISDF
jgi:hypothetical protein